MSDENWQLYHGDGTPRQVLLPEAPPWRRFGGAVERERTLDGTADPRAALFQTTPEMVDAVNAALHLRRPLLLTGRAGSGKSSLIESVAAELILGRVVRWHVTSSSTLRDALYRYDALGRLQEHQLTQRAPGISSYLRLGPLGTALLPTSRPRALLVDEIDKSAADLPSDLLNVLEQGEFEIPELARLADPRAEVREDGGDERFPIVNGKVQCAEFPFVVMTSNGERDFPPPFLRRCIQYRMPEPTPEMLQRIVEAHLGKATATEAADLIKDFAARSLRNRAQATDQLLNAIYVVTGEVAPQADNQARVVEMLLKALEGDRL